MVPLFNDYLMIINIDIDSPYQTYTLAAAKVFFLPVVSCFLSFPLSTSRQTLRKNSFFDPRYARS